MKRRRNPSLSDMNTFVTLGLIAGAGFIFYKTVWPLLQGVSKIGSGAVDSISSGIADVIVGPSNVQVQGTVLMPDGSRFPASNLTDLNFRFVDDQAQFVMNGATYALTPQVNGQYQAIAI
jgi:hypothetical protein